MIVEHVYLNGRAEAFEEPCAAGESFFVDETHDGLSRCTVYHRIGNDYTSTKYFYEKGGDLIQLKPGKALSD